MASTRALPGLRAHPRPAPYPFGPSLVADILLAGLDSHPNRLALIDGDSSWTWSELDHAVAGLASRISPGSALCWDVGNSADAVIGALATFRAGAVWIGRSSSEDRARLSPHLGEVRVISSLDDLAHSGDSLEPPVEIDPHQVAAISFTSGTSGRPKAVAHSQHNLLWPGLVSIEMEPPAEGERIGTPLSLGILNILVLGPLSALLRGSTAVMMNRTFASGFAADIEQFGVTRTFVVATMLHDLLAALEDEAVTPKKLTSIDRVVVGGAPADPALLTAFLDRFSVRPTLSYGLSEAPSGVVRESLDDPIGSRRGFPLPHIDVHIADGEICLRPASSGKWANCWTPTLGYVGEPERTDRLFDNGMLRTGDTGRLDDDGALTVTGRISNLILRGGENIDPLAVEALVESLPWVEQCLCTGVDDDRLGQTVGVQIVIGDKAPGGIDPADTDQLLGVLRTEIDAPIDNVSVVESLPRNAMGKLIRH